MTGGGQLLTQDGVTSARPAQLLTDDALGLPVGLGDRCQIRLGLHREVPGVETGLGETVHLVGDRVRQVQIISPAPLLGRGRRRSGRCRCRRGRRGRFRKDGALWAGSLAHDTTVAGERVR